MEAQPFVLQIWMQLKYNHLSTDLQGFGEHTHMHTHTYTSTVLHAEHSTWHMYCKHKCWAGTNTQVSTHTHTHTHTHVQSSSHSLSHTQTDTYCWFKSPLGATALTYKLNPWSEFTITDRYSPLRGSHKMTHL